MFLLIEEETYRPVFPVEQMLLLREFEAVHKIWGIRGLYFVVLFGWRGSPHIDEEERLREQNVLQRTDESKEWYGTGLYKKIPNPGSKLSPMRAEIKAAIAKLNEKYRIPELDDYDYYAERIGKSRETIASLVPKGKDLIEIKKAADAEMTMNKNIAELRKYQSEAESALTAKYKQKKHLSLNDLIELAKQWVLYFNILPL